MMEPIQFKCGSCGATLRAAAEKVGKKTRCPKCKEVSVVPAPDAPVAEEATPEPAITATKPHEPLAPAQFEELERKPCPYCGESILSTAVKCRHCGEFLDRSKAPPAKSRKVSTTELTPSEYFVAIVGFPFGLVIGTYWLFRRIPKGKSMLAISVLMTAIAGGTIGFLISQGIITWFKSPEPPPGPVPVYEHAPGFPPSEEAKKLQEKWIQERLKQREAMLAPPRPEELAAQPPAIQRALRASLRIEVLYSDDPLGPRAEGSGVVVQIDKNEALILTNRHVVEPGYRSRSNEPDEEEVLPRKLRVFYVTGDKVEGKVVWTAANNVDLALVRAPCPAKGVVEAPWRTMPLVITGAEVFAIGNPSGLGWTYTKGVVSGVRTQEVGTHKVPIIQTDTAISPGNSGGGLYNAKGELIGINTFIVATGQRLGFAIQVSALRQFAPKMLRWSDKEDTPAKEKAPAKEATPAKQKS